MASTARRRTATSARTRARTAACRCASSGPAWNDAVTKLSLYIHETRRLSDGHDDGVEAMWSHEDAIDATLKFGNVRKQTLSQHRLELLDVRTVPRETFHLARDPDGTVATSAQIERSDADVVPSSAVEARPLVVNDEREHSTCGDDTLCRDGLTTSTRVVSISRWRGWSLCRF